jgi:outer membrane protein assembly factor BamB
MSLLQVIYYSLLVSVSYSSPEETPNQWTRFRGTHGTGIDSIAEGPGSWEESDVHWKIDLPGTGHASPVIWQDRIFVTSSDDTGDAGYVVAVHERTGELVWTREFRIGDLTMHKDNNLAAPSPAVDESHVYLIWYSRQKTTLIALRHDGALSWRSEFGGIEGRHGGGSSLMLTDHHVVFTREQEESSSQKSSWVAVVKETGEVAWELERKNSEHNSFSTPVLIQRKDSTPLLIFTSHAHGFTAVDPGSGTVLWERKSLLSHRVVASPVYGKNRIVASRKGETVVLETDEDFNPVADTALYTLPPNLSPYVPTPIVVGDLLYLFLDNGSVACLVLASGELLWKERPAGPIYGSPVYVGGKLYCVTKTGQVIVIGAESSYELLGIHELGEESFSTPVMSDSGMVFRTFRKLMMFPN